MVVTRALFVLDSSNVTQCDYDSEDQSLAVTFSNGAKYLYEGVTQKMFGELCSSGSVGQYVNAVIKKLPTTKING